jgi:hypothetical protein
MSQGEKRRHPCGMHIIFCFDWGWKAANDAAFHPSLENVFSSPLFSEIYAIQNG